ncbi:33241_t:CDS:2 [Gigaspora margarita]|uniref:33241_t:CDS:1 n=1 Tax=Gigaspora margarita TaxID=4874 RepID=A0ABN7UU39_GIGMA|nr:33241_t:CDS:2 [Gigaspora margarita]
MTSGPIIVEPFTDLYPRFDIWDFYANEPYKPQFDLFIQSFDRSMNVPHMRSRGHPAPLEIVGLARFASFETTHDAFHIIFGDPKGHIVYSISIIFPDNWMQQNVARNGTYTEEINTVLNENTDLTPFRKTKTEFWKSIDILYIENLVIHILK